MGQALGGEEETLLLSLGVLALTREPGDLRGQGLRSLRPLSQMGERGALGRGELLLREMRMRLDRAGAWAV